MLLSACRLLVLLGVLLLITAHHPTVCSLPKCPSKCRCSADGKHADCQGIGLGRTPAAEELDPRLEWLDLRRNGLSRAEFSRLAGLPRLHTLALGLNPIRHLEKHALDVLPQLRRLHLARAQLRTLPDELASAHSNSQLQLLDLRANQLKHLPVSAFQHLPELRVLDLANNFIQSVPNGALDGNALTRLELNGNSWNCDCRIIPLLELMTNRPTLEGHRAHDKFQHKHNKHHPSDKAAECMNPGRLRNRQIRTLSREEAKCFTPLVEAKLAEMGGPTLLRCNLINSDGERTFAESIQWIFKGEPLENSVLGKYELLEDGSLMLVDSDVEVADFQCALNYLQSATRQSRNIWEPAQPNVKAVFQPPHSQHALLHSQRTNPKRIHVQRHPPRERHSFPLDAQSGFAPRFTYTPRDRRFREGTAVQLSCEAQGEPKPQIVWFFNSQLVGPSRKYEFRQNGTQLVIYPFLEHDVGSYACEAVNHHGRVRSGDARLELIRSTPPAIIEGPRTHTVRPGQRVLFRCKARGEPKPNIGWFFNGVEIAAVGGHYRVNEDGTELSIDQASRQDAGSYSCMAGNTVGSMTADAQLTVQSAQLDVVDRRLDDSTLQDIVREASQNIERAILNTKQELRAGINSPQELLRHFKFVGKQPSELSKAREVYEESLRLVQKHVELGLRLKPEESAPESQNISFESVLSVTHIQTLMELSGCMNGQFKDACQDMCFHSKYRSYTGQCNNFDHPTWGVSQMPFLRLLPPIYENGFNTPVGWDPQRLYFGFPKPNARSVSMELIGTEEVSPHPLYSAMLMQWGQFLDHDLDFAATALSRQTYVGGARCNRTCENLDPCFNIPLPPNDPRLASMGPEKLPCIEFERSAAICGSGETSPIFRQVTYREQVNIITSYIDGSQIYGSTEVDALDLRDLFSDHGLLRFDIVSAAQKPYLPFERDSAMDCRRNYSQENPIRCFLSGDFRANVQVGLTALHTIWMREHNRIATKLLEMNPDWDGERIFQETRKIVGAMLQHITYHEWLPKVLGRDGFTTLIGQYAGYSPDVNPSISNAFGTAAFRFGHTLIQPQLERLNKQFEQIPEGPLPLHEAFFAPERLLAEGGVDPLLRGLFASPLKQPMSEQLLNTELTEKLFHRAHNVSLDLAALNIQRGRDHGLPGQVNHWEVMREYHSSYLEYRRFCNLTVPSGWTQLVIDIPNPQVLAKLRSLYGHPGNIDLWVGGIVEKRLPDALVGPTFSCLIADQFKRLRAGDRFWYENPGVFTPLQLAQIRKSTLAGVICRNGDDIDRIQPDVFLFTGRNQLAQKRCEELPETNLRMWMSCCDESCPARGAQANNDGAPEEEERQRRRRRSQHIYGQ